MLRRVGTLAALLLVLLPIEGSSLVAQSEPASAAVAVMPVMGAATAGALPEAGTVTLLCLGATGLILRYLAMRRRSGGSI